jgi:hypothetical protein
MQMQALIVLPFTLYSNSQNVMGGTKETTPLVSPTRGSLGHSTSYGGQSASSNEQNTEVDYGDDDDEEAAVGDYSHNPNVDTSWAAEPPSKENSRPTVTFHSKSGTKPPRFRRSRCSPRPFGVAAAGPNLQTT